MSWVLVVTHDLQAIGSRFLVDTTFCDNVIYDLKMKVKEKWKVDLAHVDAESLTVWKLKGKNIINRSNSGIKRLAEILGNINIDDKDTVEELNTSVKAADLVLPPDETLLVQVPAVVSNEDHSLQVRDPVVSKVGSKYEDCFLRVHIKGDFIEEDMNSNGIVATYIVPDFVKKLVIFIFCRMLAKAEPFVGKAAWEKYFDNLTADQEIRFPANKREINHLIHISSVDVEKSWDPLTEGSPRHFKEDDANWLFFYALAHRFRSLHSNIASDGTLKAVVKTGQESLPFSLITQVGKHYFTYSPKNDFLVLKFGLPRVTVEVNSNPPYGPPVGLYRLMLQAASVVRFANTFIDVYKEKKTFLLVAIFVGHTGLSHRYIFYQRRDSRKVYHKRRSFRLSKEGDRMEFALELYNIASALENESDSESGDTESRVKELTEGVDKLSQDRSMPKFTSETKCTVSNDKGNQPGPSVCPKGNASGANEQLEASGYQVVPDVFETDGGTWELLVKLPPHIRTHLCDGSNELHILKYLRTIRPPSPHIISLIETVPSTTGGWLILSKLHSIRDQGFMDSRGVRGRDQLGRGLIKGLAYLHEHKVAHRDVKPSNLVCDDVFRLQIIDFDVAIEVQDENTEVDEYRGTEDWTAPEIGEEDGPTPMYSPIKADRWSCGCVLLRHMMVGKGDNRLSEFAEQLMANDPQQRPSLLEWDKWSAAPFSVAANALVDCGKEPRPRQDMVEESMKPPEAKKPRLAGD
ncbi:hypothetical protein EDB86DRAFT_3087731 [Lactarius hatsudake]|nr:hypothetical protein EDB86DRAFT_3087731 [Lactarius hatsudake]